jgi:DNA-binding response OmpR family regulator
MLNILIVDNDEDVLIRLERTLEAEGYSTTTAWSGREALSIARKSKFDVLLVDEHLADLESAIVVDKLRHLQPQAFLLLMQADQKTHQIVPHRGKGLVCKWDDDEVKARVRNSLAA